MIEHNPPTIAIDWGSKYIGLAIGRSPIAIRPLPFLRNTPEVFEKLTAILKAEGVRNIIVGQQADPNFIDQLKKSYDIPVLLEDEAYTSEEAKRLSAKNDQDRDAIDSRAAALLLEQYFLMQERGETR